MGWCYERINRTAPNLSSPRLGRRIWDKNSQSGGAHPLFIAEEFLESLGSRCPPILRRGQAAQAGPGLP